MLQWVLHTPLSFVNQDLNFGASWEFFEAHLQNQIEPFQLFESHT